MEPIDVEVWCSASPEICEILAWRGMMSYIPRKDEKICVYMGYYERVVDVIYFTNFPNGSVGGTRRKILIFIEPDTSGRYRRLGVQ